MDHEDGKLDHGDEAFRPYLRTNLFSTSCTGVSASVAAVVASVVRLYVVFDLHS